MGKTITSGKSGLASEIVLVGRVAPLLGGTAGDDSFPGTPGNDTFDGGAGSDTIFGAGGDDVLRSGTSSGSLDRLFGGEGSDTLYGGGNIDLLFGGNGNDTIYNDGSNTIGELFDGGAGDDVMILQLSNLEGAYLVDTGPDDASDGNDFVRVMGRYNDVRAQLGNGDDTYIGGTDPEQAQDGANRDDVIGGEGSDIISTWYGDDTLDAGAGADAMWGGNGGDTLFGGEGSDFLYGGVDRDTLYGGGQTDRYYWSREDGQGDQIYDEFRLGMTPTDINGMLVFGIFEPTNGTLKPGTGVFETDHDIMDKDGMVQVTDVDDGGGKADIWRLEILNGDGAGNFVEFDPRDVAVIGLSDHDAPVGQGVQLYIWNDALQVYEYDANAKFDDFEQVRMM